MHRDSPQADVAGYDFTITIHGPARIIAGIATSWVFKTIGQSKTVHLRAPGAGIISLTVTFFRSHFWGT